MSSFSKDPDEKKDYGFDWTAALNGDTISASVWTIPAPLVKESTPPESFNDTSTTVWISGGLAGENYRIENEVTTAAGRVLEESFTIRCLES